MTGFKILLAILLFLLLLLLIPITLRISYDGVIRLSAGALGMYFRILPKKQKKIRLRSFTAKNLRKRREKERLAALKKQRKIEEKERKKKAAAARRSDQKKLPPEPITDEPSTLRILLGMTDLILNTFFGKLRVQVLRMRITVGGPDASAVGMAYGIVSQSVAYLMELIALKTRFRRVHNEDIVVAADFLLEKTTAEIDLRFRLSMWDLLSTGIVLGFRFLREKYKTRPKRTDPGREKSERIKCDEREQQA